MRKGLGSVYDKWNIFVICQTRNMNIVLSDKIQNLIVSFVRAQVGICCQTKAICHTKNLWTPKTSEILDMHKRNIEYFYYTYICCHTEHWGIIIWTEWSCDLFNATWTIVQLYYVWWELVTFQWDDDDISIVLEQHAKLDFSSASSLYYSAGRLVPISSQPVFARSDKYIFYNIRFDPDQSRLHEHANHNTTNVALTVEYRLFVC